MAIIYALAYAFRNKHYPEGHPYREYFMPALNVKVFGAIAAGLIYFFYYQTGDTVFYYQRTAAIYEAFGRGFDQGLELILIDGQNPPWYLWGYHNLMRFWDTSSYMVVRISGTIALFTFNSYAAISIIFAYLSFRASWAMFTVFAEMYPKILRRMAVACLFIPSVFFWGSGLFKDTITMAGVAWMTYATYKLAFKKEITIKNMLIFFLSFYVTYVVKTYIVIAFVPSVLFWIFFTYRSKIKSKALQVLLTPIILVLSAGLGYLAVRQLGAQNQNWSIDSISDRAKDMQWWHTRVHELYGEEGGGGSSYSIGDGSFTASNIIISFPQAVATSLFRPFIWESKNPIMLLSSLEGLVFLIFTIRTLLRAGPRRTFALSISHPVIFFCMFFSIFFAFAVGFTSFNFGALVRYKIPLMPFYVIGLSLVQYYSSNSDKKTSEFATTE